MAEFKWLGTTVTNQYMTDEKVYCRLHCFQNLVFSSVTTKSFWIHYIATFRSSLQEAKTC
jgi:hypothetical protein